MKKILSVALIMLLIVSLSLTTFALATIKVTGISVSQSTAALGVGQSYSLKVNFTPANTTQKLLTYSTSNKNVAAISTKGIITGVAAGTAVITVTSSTNKALKSTIKVTVTGVPKTLYKVNVFTMLGNYAGKQTGWFAKIIKDKFNMELNMIASNVDGGGDAKFATMMASGNLGDLVIFGNDDSKYTDAIKAGYLMDMNKNNMLAKYGQEITTGFPKVLEKAKTNFGGGKSVYGLGYNASNMPSGPSEGEDMTWGPDLRWDLYAKLGYPKINTMEDYLPVLKQMQQLEPKSDSGKPTYGFSLWSDWDGDKMCLAKQYANVYGYDEGDSFNPGGIVLISNTTDKYQALLDKDSYYMKGLKLYYSANQMGLMDPDSISQKYEDVVNKYKDGQVLFSWFPWMDNIYNTAERQAAGKGIKMVPFTQEKVYSTGYNSYGGNRLICIGNKAKYPERLMQLINWMYTPEGVLMSTDTAVGPKGLAWNTDKSGKPYLTAFGKKTLPNSPEVVPAKYGGGTFKDGKNQMNINLVQLSSINPENGEAYDYHLWSSVLNENPTKLVSDWRKKMGVLTSKQYFQNNNLLAVVDPVFTGKAPAVMDKTLEQKKGQVSTVIRQYSWKMVFAKDQAEYDSLYNEMLTKAKGLGYDELIKFFTDGAKSVYKWRLTQK